MKLRARLRVVATGLLLAGLVLPLLAVPEEVDPVAHAPGAESVDRPSVDLAPQVLVLTLDGGIVQPVVAEFTREVLERAAAEDTEVVIFELSTPGGMLEATRQMWSAMLESSVPVVTYVTPQGAQAASAGFFLLLAGDVAAMSPETNTGSAHPVAGSGADIEGNMGEKVEQDAAAAIRSLAARNGRDTVLAESAVLESRSFTASEALELGLVDLVAPSLEDLLEQLNGRLVRRGQDGEKRALRTSAARVVRAEMSPFQRVRSALAHPEIAVLLMSLGSAGLFVELNNPGLLFPGVLGAICLILGFYGASILPLNYAGFALMALAVVLMIAEMTVPSFGVLGIGGVLSFVLGSLMLFRSADPALRLGTGFTVGLALAGLLMVGFLSTLALKARRAPVASGAAGMLQARGLASAVFIPEGKVFRGKVRVHGELWNARSETGVESGEEVEVVAVDGLILDVVPRKNA